MANVKVAVRVRPLSKKEEQSDATNIVGIIGDSGLSIRNVKVDSPESAGDRHRERVKHFSFDYCYYSVDRNLPNYASQELIYQDLGTEVLNSSFDGYNVSLFAYGQTGSGKTYTMLGDPHELGVIPRICEGLCSRVDDFEDGVTFKIEVSYLEIYNERVRDLLVEPDDVKYTLKVREHPKEGPYVQDLSRHFVSDYAMISMLLNKGNINRTTAATHMHDTSSRSHAIFTLHFIQAKLENGMPSEIVSKINLVDLAGSERAKYNYSKDRLQEGANINKSLVTLGNCISALAENSMRLTASNSLESLMSEDGDSAPSTPRSTATKKSAFIPYRNSVLTWLLRDSLGGNAKTIMIATISPASCNFNESMSTLRYARRAKRIINNAIINEDPNVRLIRELRSEIDRLKQLLNCASLSSSQASLVQDNTISRMLQENEQKIDQLTEAWVDKWREAARIMQECNVGIRRESVGVIVESELPHLIGMDDDLLSTGIILYHIKEGETKIGRSDADTEQDIVLWGPGVEQRHALVENRFGKVTMTPINGAMCAVNGVDLQGSTALTQGAVILLGKTNMFRFNHPAEAAKLRERRAASKLKGKKKSPPRRRNSITFRVPNSLTVLSEENKRRLSGSSNGSLLLDSDVDNEDLKNTSFASVSLDVSPFMMFNPGVELERQQKIETDKLDHTRKRLKELQEKHRQAEQAHEEREKKMKEAYQDHQKMIQEQKNILTTLVQDHEFAKLEAEKDLEELKEKLQQEKEQGKNQLEDEMKHLKEDLSKRAETAATASPNFPKVVALNRAESLADLTRLDADRKRLAHMELLQKQNEKKAEAALLRRIATFERQQRAAQCLIEQEEKRLHEIERFPNFDERFDSAGNDEEVFECEGMEVDGERAAVIGLGRVSPIGGRSDSDSSSCKGSLTGTNGNGVTKGKCNNVKPTHAKQTKTTPKDHRSMRNGNELANSNQRTSNQGAKQDKRTPKQGSKHEQRTPKLAPKQEQRTLNRSAERLSKQAPKQEQRTLNRSAERPSKQAPKLEQRTLNRSAERPSKQAPKQEQRTLNRSAERPPKQAPKLEQRTLSRSVERLSKQAPKQEQRTFGRSAERTPGRTKHVNTVQKSKSVSPAPVSRRNASRSPSPSKPTGGVFSRLYPQQNAKFDYLRSKRLQPWEEYDASRERVKDKPPELIRRDISRTESLPPIKLEGKRISRDTSPRKRSNTGEFEVTAKASTPKADLIRRPVSRSPLPIPPGAAKYPRAKLEHRPRSSSPRGPPKCKPEIPNHSAPGKANPDSAVVKPRGPTPETTPKLRSKSPSKPSHFDISRAKDRPKSKREKSEPSLSARLVRKPKDTHVRAKSAPSSPSVRRKWERPSKVPDLAKVDILFFARKTENAEAFFVGLNPDESTLPSREFSPRPRSKTLPLKGADSSEPDDLKPRSRTNTDPLDSDDVPMVVNPNERLPAVGCSKSMEDMMNAKSSSTSPSPESSDVFDDDSLDRSDIDLDSLDEEPLSKYPEEAQSAKPVSKRPEETQSAKPVLKRPEETESAILVYPSPYPSRQNASPSLDPSSHGNPVEGTIDLVPTFVQSTPKEINLSKPAEDNNESNELHPDALSEQLNPMPSNEEQEVLNKSLPLEEDFRGKSLPCDIKDTRTDPDPQANSVAQNVPEVPESSGPNVTKELPKTSDQAPLQIIKDTFLEKAPMELAPIQVIMDVTLEVQPEKEHMDNPEIPDEFPAVDGPDQSIVDCYLEHHPVAAPEVAKDLVKPVEEVEEPIEHYPVVTPEVAKGPFKNQPVPPLEIIEDSIENQPLAYQEATEDPLECHFVTPMEEVEEEHHPVAAQEVAKDPVEHESVPRPDKVENSVENQPLAYPEAGEDLLEHHPVTPLEEVVDHAVAAPEIAKDPLAHETVPPQEIVKDPVENQLVDFPEAGEDLLKHHPVTPMEEDEVENYPAAAPEVAKEPVKHEDVPPQEIVEDSVKNQSLVHPEAAEDPFEHQPVTPREEDEVENYPADVPEVAKEPVKHEDVSPQEIVEDSVENQPLPCTEAIKYPVEHHPVAPMEEVEEPLEHYAVVTSEVFDDPVEDEEPAPVPTPVPTPTPSSIVDKPVQDMELEKDPMTIFEPTPSSDISKPEQDVELEEEPMTILEPTPSSDISKPEQDVELEEEPMTILEPTPSSDISKPEQDVELEEDPMTILEPTPSSDISKPEQDVELEEDPMTILEPTPSSDISKPEQDVELEEEPMTILEPTPSSDISKPEQDVELEEDPMTILEPTPSSDISKPEQDVELEEDPMTILEPTPSSDVSKPLQDLELEKDPMSILKQVLSIVPKPAQTLELEKEPAPLSDSSEAKETEPVEETEGSTVILSATIEAPDSYTITEVREIKSRPSDYDDTPSDGIKMRLTAHIESPDEWTITEVKEIKSRPEEVNPSSSEIIPKEESEEVYSPEHVTSSTPDAETITQVDETKSRPEEPIIPTKEKENSPSSPDEEAKTKINEIKFSTEDPSSSVLSPNKEEETSPELVAPASSDVWSISEVKSTPEVEDNPKEEKEEEDCPQFVTPTDCKDNDDTNESVITDDVSLINEIKSRPDEGNPSSSDLIPKEHNEKHSPELVALSDCNDDTKDTTEDTQMLPEVKEIKSRPEEGYPSSSVVIPKEDEEEGDTLDPVESLESDDDDTIDTIKPVINDVPMTTGINDIKCRSEDDHARSQVVIPREDENSDPVELLESDDNAINTMKPVKIDVPMTTGINEIKCRSEDDHPSSSVFIPKEDEEEPVESCESNDNGIDTMECVITEDGPKVHGVKQIKSRPEDHPSSQEVIPREDENSEPIETLESNNDTTKTIKFVIEEYVTTITEVKEIKSRPEKDYPSSSEVIPKEEDNLEPVEPFASQDDSIDTIKPVTTEDAPMVSRVKEIKSRPEEDYPSSSEFNAKEEEKEEDKSEPVESLESDDDTLDKTKSVITDNVPTTTEIDDIKSRPEEDDHLSSSVAISKEQTEEAGDIPELVAPSSSNDTKEYSMTENEEPEPELSNKDQCSGDDGTFSQSSADDIPECQLFENQIPSETSDILNKADLIEPDDNEVLLRRLLKPSTDANRESGVVLTSSDEEWSDSDGTDSSGDSSGEYIVKRINGLPEPLEVLEEETLLPGDFSDENPDVSSEQRKPTKGKSAEIETSSQGKFTLDLKGIPTEIETEPSEDKSAPLSPELRQDMIPDGSDKGVLISEPGPNILAYPVNVSVNNNKPTEDIEDSDIKQSPVVMDDLRQMYKKLEDSYAQSLDRIIKDAPVDVISPNNDDMEDDNVILNSEADESEEEDQLSPPHQLPITSSSEESFYHSAEEEVTLYQTALEVEEDKTFMPTPRRFVSDIQSQSTPIKSPDKTKPEIIDEMVDYLPRYSEEVSDEIDQDISKPHCALDTPIKSDEVFVEEPELKDMMDSISETHDVDDEDSEKATPLMNKPAPIENDAIVVAEPALEDMMDSISETHDVEERDEASPLKNEPAPIKNETVIVAEPELEDIMDSIKETHNVEDTEKAIPLMNEPAPIENDEVMIAEPVLKDMIDSISETHDVEDIEKAIPLKNDPAKLLPDQIDEAARIAAELQQLQEDVNQMSSMIHRYVLPTQDPNTFILPSPPSSPSGLSSFISPRSVCSAQLSPIPEEFYSRSTSRSNSNRSSPELLKLKPFEQSNTHIAIIVDSGSRSESDEDTEVDAQPRYAIASQVTLPRASYVDEEDSFFIPSTPVPHVRAETQPDFYPWQAESVVKDELKPFIGQEFVATKAKMNLLLHVITGGKPGDSESEEGSPPPRRPRYPNAEVLSSDDESVDFNELSESLPVHLSSYADEPLIRKEAVMLEETPIKWPEMPDPEDTEIHLVQMTSTLNHKIKHIVVPLPEPHHKEPHYKEEVRESDGLFKDWLAHQPAIEAPVNRSAVMVEEMAIKWPEGWEPESRDAETQMSSANEGLEREAHTNGEMNDKVSYMVDRREVATNDDKISIGTSMSPINVVVPHADDGWEIEEIEMPDKWSEGWELNIRDAETQMSDEDLGRPLQTNDKIEVGKNVSKTDMGTSMSPINVIVTRDDNGWESEEKEIPGTWSDGWEPETRDAETSMSDVDQERENKYNGEYDVTSNVLTKDDKVSSETSMSPINAIVTHADDGWEIEEEEMPIKWAGWEPETRDAETQMSSADEGQERKGNNGEINDIVSNVDDNISAGTNDDKISIGTSMPPINAIVIRANDGGKNEEREMAMKWSAGWKPETMDAETQISSIDESQEREDQADNDMNDIIPRMVETVVLRTKNDKVSIGTTTSPVASVLSNTDQEARADDEISGILSNVVENVAIRTKHLKNTMGTNTSPISVILATANEKNAYDDTFSIPPNMVENIAPRTTSFGTNTSPPNVARPNSNEGQEGGDKANDEICGILSNMVEDIAATTNSIGTNTSPTNVILPKEKKTKDNKMTNIATNTSPINVIVTPTAKVQQSDEKADDEICGIPSNVVGNIAAKTNSIGTNTSPIHVILTTANESQQSDEKADDEICGILSNMVENIAVKANMGTNTSPINKAPASKVQENEDKADNEVCDILSNVVENVTAKASTGTSTSPIPSNTGPVTSDAAVMTPCDAAMMTISSDPISQDGSDLIEEGLSMTTRNTSTQVTPTAELEGLDSMDPILFQTYGSLVLEDSYDDDDDDVYSNQGTLNSFFEDSSLKVSRGTSPIKLDHMHPADWSPKPRSPTKKPVFESKQRSPSKKQESELQQRSPSKKQESELQQRSPSKKQESELQQRSPSKKQEFELQQRSPSKKQESELKQRSPSKKQESELKQRSPSKKQESELQQRSPSKKQESELQQRSPSKKQEFELEQRSPSKKQESELKQRSPSKKQESELQQRSPSKKQESELQQRSPSKKQESELQQRSPSKKQESELQQRSPSKKQESELQQRSPSKKQESELQQRSPTKKQESELQQRSPTKKQESELQQRSPSKKQESELQQRSPSKKQESELQQRSPSKKQELELEQRSPSKKQESELQQRSPSKKQESELQQRSPSKNQESELKQRSPSKKQELELEQRSPSKKQELDFKQRSPNKNQEFELKHRSPRKKQDFELGAGKLGYFITSTSDDDRTDITELDDDEEALLEKLKLRKQATELITKRAQDYAKQLRERNLNDSTSSSDESDLDSSFGDNGYDNEGDIDESDNENINTSSEEQLFEPKVTEVVLKELKLAEDGVDLANKLARLEGDQRSSQDELARLQGGQRSGQRLNRSAEEPIVTSTWSRSADKPTVTTTLGKLLSPTSSETSDITVVDRKEKPHVSPLSSNLTSSPRWSLNEQGASIMPESRSRMLPVISEGSSKPHQCLPTFSDVSSFESDYADDEDLQALKASGERIDQLMKEFPSFEEEDYPEDYPDTTEPELLALVDEDVGDQRANSLTPTPRDYPTSAPADISVVKYQSTGTPSEGGLVFQETVPFDESANADDLSDLRLQLSPLSPVKAEWLVVDLDEPLKKGLKGDWMDPQQKRSKGNVMDPLKERSKGKPDLPAHGQQSPHLLLSSGIFTASQPMTDSMMSTKDSDDQDLFDIHDAYEDLLQAPDSNLDGRLSRDISPANACTQTDAETESIASNATSTITHDMSFETERRMSCLSELESLRDEKEFVYSRMGNTLERRDVSVELLEAQMMHGMGEMDAMLNFLDTDLPVEDWFRQRRLAQEKQNVVVKNIVKKQELIVREVNMKLHTSHRRVDRRTSQDSISMSHTVHSHSVSPRVFNTSADLNLSSVKSSTLPALSSSSRTAPSEYRRFLQNLRQGIVAATATQEDEQSDVQSLLEESQMTRANSRAEIARAKMDLNYHAMPNGYGGDRAHGGADMNADGSRSHSAPVTDWNSNPGDKNKGNRRLSGEIEDAVDREISCMRAASAALSSSTDSLADDQRPMSADSNAWRPKDVRRRDSLADDQRPMSGDANAWRPKDVRRSSTTLPTYDNERLRHEHVPSLTLERPSLEGTTSSPVHSPRRRHPQQTPPQESATARTPLPISLHMAYNRYPYNKFNKNAPKAYSKSNSKSSSRTSSRASSSNSSPSHTPAKDNYTGNNQKEAVNNSQDISFERTSPRTQPSQSSARSPSRSAESLSKGRSTDTSDTKQTSPSRSTPTSRSSGSPQRRQQSHQSRNSSPAERDHTSPARSIHSSTSTPSRSTPTSRSSESPQRRQQSHQSRNSSPAERDHTSPTRSMSRSNSEDSPKRRPSPMNGRCSPEDAGRKNSSASTSPQLRRRGSRTRSNERVTPELPPLTESLANTSYSDIDYTGEQAVATLFTEMIQVGGFNPINTQHPTEYGGWRLQGLENGIILLQKTRENNPIDSFMGISTIKAPARTVFGIIRDISKLKAFDTNLQDVKVLEDLPNRFKILHLLYTTDKCYLQKSRDACVVFKDSKQHNKYVIAATSIRHRSCPDAEGVIRAKVLCCGIGLEPVNTPTGEHCKLIYLSQVDLKGELQPKLTNVIMKKQPMCIERIRKYVESKKPSK